MKFLIREHPLVRKLENGSLLALDLMGFLSRKCLFLTLTGWLIGFVQADTLTFQASTAYSFTKSKIGYTDPVELGSNGRSEYYYAPVVGFDIEPLENLVIANRVTLTLTVDHFYSGGFAFAGEPVIAEAYVKPNESGDPNNLAVPGGGFTVDGTWLYTGDLFTFPAGTHASPYVLPYGTEIEIDLTDELLPFLGHTETFEFAALLWPIAFNGGSVEFGRKDTSREPYLEIEYSLDVDTDGDGIGNNADTDDDGDGVADGSDAFPLDSSEALDTDGDGVGDNTDAFPLDSSESVDTDGDGTGNNADTDDDNDGILDLFDAEPLFAANTWTQLGDDIDGEAGTDESGSSIAVSADGTVVAVGANLNDGNGENSGHVRVYSYDSSEGAWIQLGDDIDGEAAYDYAGNSVSLSTDGTVVAVGANLNNGNGEDSGHVRVYSYASSEGAWIQLGDDIDGEGVYDNSGFSVSLNADGSVVAIGAPNADSNAGDTGHVRVHSYDSASASWQQLGSDIDGEAWNDQSGYSVSLSSDGTIVAIGAVYNSGNGSSSGHTRVYGYDPVSASWMQLGSDIDGEASGDKSGYSVSLSTDGTIVAIGAHYNSGNGSESGHVRVFSYDSTSASWQQLGSDIDGEAVGDQSGYSVSLSSDGTIVAIGAIYNDGNGSSSGHARVYGYDPVSASWQQLGGDINGERADDRSAYSVALNSDGTLLSVGAKRNSESAVRAGHVRTFKFSGLYDTDNDGIGDLYDLDDDNDGIPDISDAFPLDSSESLDTDGDGIGNNSDADDDDDGILDIGDAFPLDPNESADADSDGIGDKADTDDDNDGVSDDEDAFPLNPNESSDSDGDGTGDNADAFPFDSGETEDTDSDGVGDQSDAFPEDPSESLDSDGDGIGDNADTDDDGDGVLDASDAFPLDSSETLDRDGDGTGDNADTDDDGDGVADNADAFPLDSSETLDTDGDGTGDNSDALPLNPQETLDSDNDGTGNNADTDDDNDGVPDTDDTFPLDSSESLDSDGDGTGNNADIDDDNDGVADLLDAFPLDNAENLDTDNDGVGNNADKDDDGDGYGDELEQLAEANPLDSADSATTEGFLSAMNLPVVEEKIQEGKQQVLASPMDFGLQTDQNLAEIVEASKQEGRRSVIDSAADHGFISSTEYEAELAASVEIGINQVKAAPADFGLFTQTQIDTAPSAAKSIINVSTRAFLGEGEYVTPGFVVLGKSKRMLIRAVGPKLADLGVETPLGNPKMVVFKARWDGNPPDLMVSVDDWASDNSSDDLDALVYSTQAVGAFPLEPTLVFQGRPFMTEDLKSAAALVTLDVGVYTIQVSSADDGVGEVLVEVYEITD